MRKPDFRDFGHKWRHFQGRSSYKWSKIQYYQVEKRVILPPKRGGPIGGLRAPERGGPRAPKTPKMGSFWAIFGLFGQKTPEQGEIGTPRPLKRAQKSIFWPIFQKSLGPPRGNWKNAKKGLVFGLKFSKTFEKSWKKGPFLANPGDLGSRGPFYPLFACQYPQPPAFLGPSYVWFCICCLYRERVTTHNSPYKKPFCMGFVWNLTCQYPQPPALLGPSYVVY